MPISLLYADDHLAARLGLDRLLQGTGIELTAQASNGEEALQFLAKEKFDVVVLDIRMPHSDGLHALGRIKLDHPEQPVLLYSIYDNPTYIARAVALGANGFVLKSEPGSTLIEAIKKVKGGESVWTREELRKVTGALSTPRAMGDAEVPLTTRENEVLKLLANGMTNKQISEQLEISYETVKEHVQHILRKIGVTDRTQAAVWAVRKNIV
jgi:DNA-binding NarL/FixJ family response regulator